MKFILSILVCFLFVNSILTLDKKDCKCRIIPEKRIVGGKIANKLAYPWQGNLGFKDRFEIPDSIRKQMPLKYKTQFHSCGLSILNENWVITAAHCIPTTGSPYTINDLQVGYGANDLAKLYDDKLFIEIEDAFVHPQYSTAEGKITHDIALIKLKTPIKFTRTIQPACIGVENVDKYSGTLKMSGWGSINKVVFSSDKEKIRMPIVSRFLKEGEATDMTDSLKLCQKDNKAAEFICVDNEKTHESACKGDSGGPLHSTDKAGLSKLIGLTSHGDVEINEDENTGTVCVGPTAYTRVSVFKDFIEQHVGQEYCH